jgi:hypothetical protein
MKKLFYVIIGIVIGWISIGLLVAGYNTSYTNAFWTDWQQDRIISLLEDIAENTKK